MLGDFKRLMGARFFFTLGVQMQAIVLGWHMYVLTKDPLYLGLIGLAEALPALGLALFAGYIVDQSRPLFVYRYVLLVSLLSGLVFCFTQWPTLTWDTHTRVYALFVSSLLTGTARAFSQPAVFAAVPRLVTREQIGMASAWMSSAMQVARVSGPAIGGMCYGLLGVMTTAGLVCVLIVISLLCHLSIKSKLAALPKLGSETRFVESLLSGAKFVFSSAILLPAMALDMISVLFGGVTALLPIYAAEILHVNAMGLGFLRASPAIGAATMSFWLTRRQIKKQAGRKLFLAVAGFGVCILVFAVSRSYVLSFVALVLSGAFDSVSMVVRTTAVQLASPDNMRGRISAVNSMFIGSSNELGEFESGVAARLLGTVPAAIFGGVMCLVTVGILSWRCKALRSLDWSDA